MESKTEYKNHTEILARILFLSLSLSLSDLFLGIVLESIQS